MSIGEDAIKGRRKAYDTSHDHCWKYSKLFSSGTEGLWLFKGGNGTEIVISTSFLSAEQYQ